MLNVSEPSNNLFPNKTSTHHAASRVTKMRAIVQHSYGSADVLEQTKVDIPSIGSREVLIEVHAAGLDRGTWHLMTGTPYLIRAMGFGLTKPKQPIPGYDVAGKVKAVGSEVTRFVPGLPKARLQNTREPMKTN